jgi:hypothetical protein
MAFLETDWGEKEDETDPLVGSVNPLLVDRSNPSEHGLAPRRVVGRRTVALFILWTALFWGGVGVLGVLFYLSVLDFVTSAKTALYFISVWLNGWLIPLVLSRISRNPDGSGSAKWFEVWHECLVLWQVSYAITNIFWEIPWVLASPFVFEGLTTLDDVVAKSDWMRESPVNMWFWALSAFASVDLRTVNHSPTFYALELYSFVNVFTVAAFLVLNHRFGASLPPPALSHNCRVVI